MDKGQRALHDEDQQTPHDQDQQAPHSKAPQGTDRPDFGPRGYLPRNAARRARKIVLRAPLGLQWIVATAAAGAVVLVAGLLFLRSAGIPPEGPFVAVGSVADIGDATLLDSPPALLVGASRGVRAFRTGDQQPRWCPVSGRLESASGRVWSLTGRALDGGASLAGYPVVVHDGVTYLDPTGTVPPPSATQRDIAPACDASGLVPSGP